MAATKKPQTTQRTRKDDKPEIVPEPDTPTCTVPDCDKPVYVRGLCEAHWEDPKKA